MMYFMHYPSKKDTLGLASLSPRPAKCYTTLYELVFNI